MSASNRSTNPTGHLTAPSERPAPKRGQTEALLREHEMMYLGYLADFAGDHVKALEAAGYHPSTPESAHEMHYQLTERINRDVDMASVLAAMRMGKVEWALRLHWLSYQDQAKYVAVGVKIWAVPLGVFTPQQSGQGATINISMLQSNGHPSSQPGLVNVTVDARKPLPSSYDSESATGPEVQRY